MARPPSLFRSRYSARHFPCLCFMMSFPDHVAVLSSCRLTFPSAVATRVAKIKVAMSLVSWHPAALAHQAPLGLSWSGANLRSIVRTAQHLRSRVCHARRTTGFQCSRSRGHATHMNGSGTTRASGEGGTPNVALSRAEGGASRHQAIGACICIACTSSLHHAS
ncbi:hypothetical protein P171DRAFT_228706 [Karstenula rhodostoma CBS 690.94]|uniref:Uncharacterized protein n=1 Tax=Karstenula rhodostoma CBS 690.94 TaxID=1392251 RepID=A0A9P4UFL2_9PLEO|nr:hypothetical protein P171DRAFT_228706 [Karstenula rhodostoma CBS 690.94]